MGISARHCCCRDHRCAWPAGQRTVMRRLSGVVAVAASLPKGATEAMALRFRREQTRSHPRRGWRVDWRDGVACAHGQELSRTVGGNETTSDRR
jgi:hypothetical protein